MNSQSFAPVRKRPIRRYARHPRVYSDSRLRNAESSSAGKGSRRARFHAFPVGDGAKEPKGSHDPSRDAPIIHLAPQINSPPNDSWSSPAGLRRRTVGCSDELGREHRTVARTAPRAQEPPTDDGDRHSDWDNRRSDNPAPHDDCADTKRDCNCDRRADEDIQQDFLEPERALSPLQHSSAQRLFRCWRELGRARGARGFVMSRPPRHRLLCV